MTDREVMQQALEALAIADNIELVGAAYTPKSIDLGLRKIRDSATALRAALEQQAEPVAWMDREGDLYKMPEIKNWAPPHVLLYTAPPKRPWVGLTRADIDEIWKGKEMVLPWDYDRTLAIEAKLKERNNG